MLQMFKKRGQHKTQQKKEEELKFGDDKNNTMGFVEKFVEVMRLWGKTC